MAKGGRRRWDDLLVHMWRNAGISLFGDLVRMPLCRLSPAVNHQELRRSLTSRAGYFVLSLLLGFALSAFLLLPFIEFMAYAHDVHQPANLRGGVPGLGHDVDWHHIITYFFPFLVGSPLLSMFGDPWGGLCGYWGVLASLFSIVGILTIFSKSTLKADPRKGLVVFFLGTFTLVLLKRFGSPVVNWIGMLPLAKLVLFVKYGEPLLAFCIAILAGFGLSFALKRQNGVFFLGLATVIAISLLLAMIVWCQPLFTADVAPSFYWTIVVAVVLISLPLTLCSLASPGFPHPIWLQWTFVGLLSDRALLQLYPAKLLPVQCAATQRQIQSVQGSAIHQFHTLNER